MHKHSIDWTVDETPCDTDVEMVRIQAELDKRTEEGIADLRLRLAGASKFVDLRGRYVSEWNVCKDASGAPNALAAAVHGHYADRDHPTATSHEELMFMCGRSRAGYFEEAKQRRLWHLE